MMLSAIIAPVLATSPLSPAVTLSERASTPVETGVVNVAAGVSRRDAGPPSLETGVDLRVQEGISLQGSVRWEERELSPALGARFQLLSQDVEGGMDLTTSLNLRAMGMEDSGPALELRGTGAKRWGRLTTLLTGMVGRSLDERGDIDFETGAVASVRVAGPISAGVEARMRGELVDSYETEEDLGRPVEVLAGPSLSLRLGAATLNVLGGYRAPRGLGSPGLAGYGSAAFDF